MTLSDTHVRRALEYSEIGGGQQYVWRYPTRIVTRSNADVVVTSQAQFRTEATRSGQRTIWIPSNTSIDIGNWSATIRNKVIASDRGQNGAPGGLLYTNTRGQNSRAFDGGSRGVFQSMRNVRITGLRYRGPTHNYWANRDSRWPGYMPLTDASTRNQWHACGMRIQEASSAGRSVEIDNCEIYGWPTMAIYVSPGSPYIHHNDMHDNMMTSFGYHVDVVRGLPRVEYNYMNNHRHALDTFGYHDSGWIARYNVVGPDQSSHAFDAHGLHNNLSEARTNTTLSSSMYLAQASGNMIAERNTFLARRVIDGPGVNFDRNRPTWAISIRGMPWPRSGNGIIIRRNWFAHPQIERNGSGNGVRDWNHGGPCNQQVSGSNGSQRFSLSTNSNRFTSNYRYSDNRFNAPTAGYREGYGAPIDFANPQASAIGTPAGPGDIETGLDSNAFEQRQSRRQAVVGDVQETAISLAEIRALQSERK